MKKNKSKSRFGSAAVIYLFALLIVVLIYLGTAYPKMAQNLNSINTEMQKLRYEINLLNPYVSQLADLNKKAEQAEKEYAENTELDEPVKFSNIIYDCADRANVEVISVAISENPAVEIKGNYESVNYSAAVAISAQNSAAVERFISLLEQNQGSAMFVQNLSYSINEETIEATATIIMYTVKK